MPRNHLFSVETYNGRSKRRGFTLVELLIVVVIVGILATIAIPKFTNTKGKAFAVTLKADLRNLSVAEESYFYDNAVYTSTVSSLDYNSSPGVVINITTASAVGWSASATHPDANPLTCSVFMGGVTPATPATVEGAVACQ